MLPMRQFTPVMSVLIAATIACHATGNPGALRPSRWSGSFKPSSASSELGRAMPNNGFGSITVTPVQAPTQETTIDISINAPAAAGEHVGWALLSGTCGSAHPALTGKSEFPMIEVGSNGAGSLRVDMPLTLNANRSYHADVYWPNSSRDLNDVMMCANMSFGG